MLERYDPPEREGSTRLDLVLTFTLKEVLSAYCIAYLDYALQQGEGYEGLGVLCGLVGYVALKSAINDWCEIDFKYSNLLKKREEQ